MKNKITVYIVALFILCPFFFACSSKDSDNADEPILNSPTQMKKSLVGYWDSEDDYWSFGEMFIFKDNCIIGLKDIGYIEACGTWDYNNQTIIINAGWESTLMTVHSLLNDQMTCSSPSYKYPAIGYKKVSNKVFAAYFVYNLGRRFFNLPSNIPLYDFDFDDDFNGVSSTGKKIQIKNPFELKRSSIIYEGEEYKFDEEEYY